MKQTGTQAAIKAQNNWNGVERRRVETVVETLATLRSSGESLSEVAHDARNMVAALTLYCDLLDAPGVLGTPFAHYAQELRLVAGASRHLVEKLVALDGGRIAGMITAAGIPELPEINAGRAAAMTGEEDAAGIAAGSSAAAASANSQAAASTGNRAEDFTGDHAEIRVGDRIRRGELLAALPVANLAAELAANRNLLAALAGPAVILSVETEGGAQPVRLTSEDLTRLLVNLVKNAAEAMPRGGRIAIALHEADASKSAAPSLMLTVEDNGPGIPEDALDKIFTSGYTSRATATVSGSWPQMHRGLGLAIVRSIVEGAGGRITAANRKQGGACFTLDLPVRKRQGPGIRD